MNQSGVVSLDYGFFIQLGAIVLTIIIAITTATWVISRALTNNYHAVDLRLERIETVVTPYGEVITKLSDQQATNVAKINRLEAQFESLSTLKLELNTLRDQMIAGRRA